MGPLRVNRKCSMAVLSSGASGFSFYASKAWYAAVKGTAMPLVKPIELNTEGKSLWQAAENRRL